MSGGSKQSSLRKAIGAIKDTTTVSLARVNSGYKELDINIVKATNHVERPAKEKYIKAVFAAVSAIRPRADVAYCIHALARRLGKTHNWAVAMKSLILIHRALREVDPPFLEELINHSKTKAHMLNMAHFRDDSSPQASDYSFWVRNYALFLEERLECFRVLKYDVETQRPRTKDLDTPDLLDQLPALQQLLFRIVSCQPQGAAVHNPVIRYALSMVASESIRVYNAIKDGTINLADKFFEMRKYDAQKALDIYRRAGKQAERLSEFYDVCTSLDIGRGEKYAKIEQPPVSFIQSMEEYIRHAAHTSTVRKDLALDAPEVILAIECEKTPALLEKRPPSPPSPEPLKVQAHVQPDDLLGLNDPLIEVSASDEKNASTLAIVPVDYQSTTNGPDQANGVTSWELELVTALNPNESTAASCKPVEGQYNHTLYDDATKTRSQNMSYNPWEQSLQVNPLMAQTTYNPFYTSNNLAAPPVHMEAMASQQQQQAFMLQQQQMMLMMQPQQQHFNSFGNPYGAATHQYGSGMPVQAYNSCTRLI